MKSIVTFALVAAIITTLALALTISTTTTTVYARGCEKNNTCGQDPDQGEIAEAQKEADDAAAEANEVDVD